MNKIKKYVKNSLKEQKEMLDGGDFEHYKTEFGMASVSDEDNGDKVSDIIGVLDIDGIDFNAGYEQGYMHALHNVLAEVKRICEQYKKISEQYKKVNVGEVQGRWKCLECKHEIMRSYEDTAEAFEPYCDNIVDGEKCGTVMVFANNQPMVQVKK